jgi:DnaJ-class molecular chaperone with C-terminal Zn finger domain
LGNILRGFGYGIAVILILAGIALFAVDFETAMLGIVLIIIGIIIIWAIRRSGQVRHMQGTDSKGYYTTKKCPVCQGSRWTSSYMGGTGGLSGFPKSTLCWRCNGKGKVKN